MILVTIQTVKNIMISAGEASGDAHAAHALSALRDTGFSFTAFGMGAGQLEATGCELIVDCRDLSVIGFVDVLKNYHRFLQRLKQLRLEMKRRRPDLLVLVDFPDFNLKLAATAKKLGIPVLFYVSPQIWAWRTGRIIKIGKLVDHMACLLPFETAYYDNQNIPASYVGNPVVEDAICNLDRQQARASLHLDPDRTVFALLPGSRPSELERLLPVMIEAAQELAQQYPDGQFVLPRAGTLTRESILSTIEATSKSAPEIQITEGHAFTAMRAADCVICASGTATLETALIGTPLVVIYKVAPLNYAIMSRLIKIDHISLVNIVAGKEAVRELIQHDATANNIVAEVHRIMQDSHYRNTMLRDLDAIKEKMGEPGASKRVAELIRKMSGGTSAD